jgi:hypothetical protein
MPAGTVPSVIPMLATVRNRAMNATRPSSPTNSLASAWFMLAAA